MKTVDEILANWETEQHNDWYAVDNYDPVTRSVHRLYVGDGETACKMAGRRASGYGLVDYAGEPAEPGWDGNALFYRATLIDAAAAHDYLSACLMDGLPEHVNELIPFAQAAKELGIARQSCYELVKRGVLPSEECDGIRVGRYSVFLRNAAKG